jgi:uncharacterized membrane protein
MSEGKRSQEEKSWQKALRMVLKAVPILCFIAVFVFFFMLFDMKKKIDDNKQNTTNTNTVVNTTISNSTTTNSSSNKVSNELPKETNTNASNENVTQTVDTNNNQNEHNHTELAKPEEDPDIKQAKEIFTEFWGEDSNSNIDVYKNSSGEYIVRLTSMQTGGNQFFKVDIDSKTVSEY